MESIQSKLLKAILWIINQKKMWEVTGGKLKKNIEKKQLSENYEPPKKFLRRYDISEKEMNGSCYYVIKPLKDVGTKHILFIHGGGYVYQIMLLEWKFIGKLLNDLQCTITVPIYPLAPKHQNQEAFDMIVPIYQQIISQVKPEDIVIMGDSAGGGMSLSLTQLLNEKDLPQPKNIILISPALDMSFTNPEIQEVEKLDLELAVPALVEIGKWYSGSKGSKDYLVSPIYGNIEGLGKISLFIGTHDILHPDAKKFKRMADEKGIKINYHEYQSMIHVWPLFQLLPESKKATKQIIEIIMA